MTKGMQEEDLVQVTLECPDLDFKVIWWENPNRDIQG
jgi:hypothetical protein